MLRFIDAIRKFSRISSGEGLDVVEDRPSSRRVSRSRANRAVSFKDAIRESVDEIEKLYARTSNVTDLPTGIRDLDVMTGGLKGSEMVVLAARPSMGKTALMSSILQFAGIDSNIPCAIFALDMSASQFAQRMLSSVSGVNAHKIRTGFMSGDDKARVSETARDIADAPLYIEESSMPSVYDVRTRVKRLKRDHGIKLVVVDYLQRVHGSRDPLGVSRIMRELKNMAVELDIVVVVLSQLPRSVEENEGHRPMLYDLEKYGEIAGYADQVWFLYREEYYDPTDSNRRQAELIVSKNRTGPVGVISLKFESEYIRFKALEIPDFAEFEE